MNTALCLALLAALFVRRRHQTGHADGGDDEADADPLPGWFVLFTGVVEMLGAIGLILPWLLRIRPGLTPLAAAGLVIVMIGATVYTFAAGDVASALIPLLVGILCAFVAYGRWRLSP
jgi:hypothetical protein